MAAEGGGGWEGGRVGGYIRKIKSYYRVGHHEYDRKRTMYRSFHFKTPDEEPEALRQALEYKERRSLELGLTKNPYKIAPHPTPGHPDCAHVLLSGGYVTYCDIEDLPLFSNHVFSSMRSSNTVYGITRSHPDESLLHRILLRTELVVDHIDGNGLNNCRWNLREVTKLGNARNHVIPQNSPTGVPGVTLAPSKRYFQAQWCEQPKVSTTVRFNISEHGYDGAFRLACEARWTAEKALGIVVRKRERVDTVPPDTPYKRQRKE